MSKWKVNLDRVWNLPVGKGALNRKGKYCAVGLVGAGVFGETFGNFDYGNYNRTWDLFIEDLNPLFGESVITNVGLVFDQEVRKNPEKKEEIREKYVRMILQKGMEAGIFELEDSDLELVKELKSVQQLGSSRTEKSPTEMVR